MDIPLFSQTNSNAPLLQKEEKGNEANSEPFTPTHKSKFLDISKWSSPKKASILSAVLPGAGQIYNKKYWKVPIIYGLGGFLVYNTIQQNNNYQYFKKELLNVLNGGISKEGYSANQLTLLKNQSKKWRDLSIAGVVLVYILNIIDANVDAHLKTFDVSDDLSLNISPNFMFNNVLSFNSNYCSYTLSIHLKWK